MLEKLRPRHSEPKTSRPSRLKTPQVITALFERDNWTCQLCGDAVNPSLKYPDPMAATIDHIVPLVDGGEHSYANTQLAHALCNSLKGDRETGSMMFAA